MSPTPPTASPDLEAARDLYARRTFEKPGVFLRAARQLPEGAELRADTSPVDAGIIKFAATVYGPGWRHDVPPRINPAYVVRALEIAATAKSVHDELDRQLYAAVLEYDDLTGHGHVSLLSGRIVMQLGPTRDRPTRDKAAIARQYRAADDLAARRERSRDDLERALSDLVNARLRADAERREAATNGNGS